MEREKEGEMKQETISRGGARDIVLRALRAFGTEHRGHTKIGNKDMGRFSCFHDVDVFHCDECKAVNCGGDIIDVSSANEDGSFTARCTIRGCSDEAEEEAEALRALLDALDSIGFHLTDPPAPHITVQQVRARMRVTNETYAASHAALIQAADDGYSASSKWALLPSTGDCRCFGDDSCEWCKATIKRRDEAAAQDAALHPTGKCRCAGEGTCEWCGGNEKRQEEQDEYDEKDSYNDRCR